MADSDLTSANLDCFLVPKLCFKILLSGEVNMETDEQSI